MWISGQEIPNYFINLNLGLLVECQAGSTFPLFFGKLCRSLGSPTSEVRVLRGFSGDSGKLFSSSFLYDLFEGEWRRAISRPFSLALQTQ